MGVINDWQYVVNGHIHYHSDSEVDCVKVFALDGMAYIGDNNVTKRSIYHKPTNHFTLGPIQEITDEN